ncbi:MAG: AAA family ATPase [Thermoguttaceae bacterium]|nr:AAA family ATPase [Thermoguttaceae bacterium]
MNSNLFRVLSLPTFPPSSEDGTEPVARDPYAPRELLGGFLVGPENRLAELAVRFVLDGVPVFDRPLGAPRNGRAKSGGREPSRADVEYLMSAVDDAGDERGLSGIDLLYDRETRNARAKALGEPLIVGYRRFDELPFLSPLVFYGPSGSGKTALIEGICQRRRLAEPSKTLYYLSATEFARALTDAIRRGQTELFRRLFEQAQCVAIENADVLATKEAAQNEFLPMLDSFIKLGKPAILSFSKLPSAIPGLLPDLVARLSSGLLAPTKLPGAETRARALDIVAPKLGLRLDAETRALCLERLPSPMGGFCGALVQAAREFATFRVPATYENMLEYLDGRAPKAEWTLETIVKTVAKHYGVSIVETRGKKRQKTLVRARQCVAYLARRLTNATLKEIGEQFSSRDHSTILHSIREFEDALQKDEQTRRDLRALVVALNAERVIKIDG